MPKLPTTLKIKKLRSPIHANGVIAIAPIRKGEAIVEYKGRLMTHAAADEVYHGDVTSGHTFLFTLNDEWIIDANVRGTVARWINTSCQPNAIAFIHSEKKKNPDPEKDRVIMEALRAIKPGEEITYDYGFEFDVPYTAKLLKTWAAEAAARAVGGVVAVPVFGPERPNSATDFNDLATLEGLDALRPILEAARDAIAGPTCDDSSPAAPDTAPEAQNPASAPETAPAAPADDAAKPAKRTRSKGKPKTDSVQTPAQGGDVFELRDGNEGRGVYRLKVEKRGDTWSEVAQFVCAPLEITHQVRRPRRELATPRHLL